MADLFSVLRIAYTLALGAALAAPAAVAAPFPDRPVRLVVPYPPGGGADIFARTLSEPLAAQLGQPVIVENRPGANGIIGTDAVARAAPDGYTILLGNSGPNAINQAIYPDLPYDAVDSFEEVSLIGYTTHVLVVNPGVEARSVTELIELARRSPGRLNFASTGQGGTPHLAGELFKLMTGTDMVHVPYKGASPSNADVIAGQVQLTFNTLPPLMTSIKAGKVRALAVTGKQRSQLLPEVPTIDEAGVAGYDVQTWYGIHAPAGTPAAVVDRLNQALVAVLSNAQVRAALVGQGYEVATSTPGEFSRMVRDDVAKWRKVVKEARVKVD
ncbi:tripartite tricarboxylate transporter substrate binding protein [Bordetella bronchiseptica]|uniref:tripartite tricarboxylate transporter substrate binding protein n=1 Tax=Bordetella bronchiseptica TaxID=518 RepID=UPI00028B031A|nr:tripartite tricarboxylate transporter substrate binding protein [Bordetella bronchiseptica]AWP59974.1 ABC transporter substrate-binding protein [Bordetella bronchiseptica]AZW32208.1 tripartite tricarboxylate transporter substrate binding protein [Bordetella bronchiseptica]KAK54102.1 tripartite tricarboxylate transporter family receptor [Bordetella bronchiseptica OSU054]KAK67327.1 tripartite tricarboxylate transporter family receptor [Bordetella bronchiseptica MO211]KAK73313.1 tripartite tri